MASACENIDTIPEENSPGGNSTNDKPAPTLKVVTPVIRVNPLASITSLVDLLIKTVATPTSTPPIVCLVCTASTPLPTKLTLVTEPPKPTGAIPSSSTVIPSTVPDGAPDGAPQNLLPFTSPYNTKSLLDGKPKLGSASSRPRNDGNPVVCCLSVDRPA